MLFLFILLLWFVGGVIFKYNADFYEKLKLPVFTLNRKLFSFIWLFMYILITISIYKLINKTNIFSNKDYFYVLLTNYLAVEVFSLMFFYLMSPFLGFVISTIVFISSIFLYIETKKIDKKASYYLIPYVVYTFYAFILSLTVHIMNF